MWERFILAFSFWDISIYHGGANMVLCLVCGGGNME